MRGVGFSDKKRGAKHKNIDIVLPTKKSLPTFVITFATSLRFVGLHNYYVVGFRPRILKEVSIWIEA
ncbi:MAG: hypothetical protein D6769_02435 [Methanobacteriota archaeon]|nr:MAG: hypothetical protein D6769_02435 [Euryarchaeota archaeon]